ncbi:MAG: hypothetical protein PHT75_01200 [Bacilli bacterium]|nr:hypothetical protein [Bacilli bacterium]MDD3304732.1 hypothetical protein [Bacilli bacterium]MDD4053589.1 hypothetical protein [Bacilli bacterium]MDD4411088.1 hypothetical protein [Bacilli bacterium]
MNKKNILIVTIIILVAAIVCYLIFNYFSKSLSYVNISINPSVELAINNNNIVEEVIPINEEADIIVSDLELVGMNIDEASETIIDAAIETGYIDEYSYENIIVVTAADDNEQVRQRIEERVMETINKRFENKEIFPVVITGASDEIKAEAAKYDISIGKTLIINRAVLLDTSLTKDELVTLSVKEIQQEIKDVVTARHEASTLSKEELKTKLQEEKEVLRKTYKTRVRELENNLLDEAGFDTATMTEEQKRNATSDVLKEKKEELKEKATEIKNEIKNTPNNETYIEIRGTMEKNKTRTNQNNNNVEKE